MNLKDLHKVVINLPGRTGRLALVKKELEGVEFSIVPGVILPDPVHGIAKAHLNCIELAKDLDHVLIMEDDVVLRRGAFEHLDKAIKALPEDWDILLGGAYETKNLKPVNEYWDKVSEFCGLQFYIVNKKAYDKILSYDFNSNQHFDRWLGKVAKLNCYLLKKYIATQRSGFSDNVKKEMDYSYLIKPSKLL